MAAETIQAAWDECGKLRFPLTLEGGFEVPYMTVNSDQISAAFSTATQVDLHSILRGENVLLTCTVDVSPQGEIVGATATGAHRLGIL